MAFRRACWGFRGGLFRGIVLSVIERRIFDITALFLGAISRFKRGFIDDIKIITLRPTSITGCFPTPMFLFGLERDSALQ